MDRIGKVRDAIADILFERKDIRVELLAEFGIGSAV